MRRFLNVKVVDIHLRRMVYGPRGYVVFQPMCPVPSLLIATLMMNLSLLLHLLKCGEGGQVIHGHSDI